ncbi:hypothetical protein ACFV9W_25135 [Streptomyces sp. NPDC059897]|uniref:hypothetical protein n=1 Tax=Streptomyces sp. NPDC059897 TaxID=3346994 RepID=UPI003660A54B
MTDNTTQRRLRSGTVALGGVGLLAAALTACSSGSDVDKRCIDRNSYNAGKGYKIVSDKHCKSSSGSTGKSSVNGGWYYGGSKKSGARVGGGSFSKPSGGGVTRGGFGSGGKGGSSGG